MEGCEIVDIGLNKYASAHLASAYVSQLDKVETSRYLVKIFQDICSEIDINDEIGYLSAILTTGRILDLKAKSNNLIEEINEIIQLFRNSVTEILTAPIIGNEDEVGAEQLIEAYKVSDNDIASALLTTSYVSLTREIESVKKIVELWGVIRDEQMVQHKLDYLAAILATGRIRDLKSKVNVPLEIKQIIQDLKKVMVDNFQLKLESIEQRDISCALISAAYVSITPPIETNSKIINLWNSTRNVANLKNEDIDFIIAILIGGIIRGMKLEDDWEDLNVKIENIRNNLG